MTPYKRFSDLCTQNNVTAGKVASATNIDRSTFTRWKQGVYTPKIDKLVAIANYFEVPVTDFIEGYGDGKVSS
jgi:transcriptional regulator with XRE-family HTH domain